MGSREEHIYMFRSYSPGNGRRAGLAESLKHDITDHITYTLALDRGNASRRDLYMSAAWTIRDRLAERWAATQRRYKEQDAKRVYYLSLEFLMGRTFGNALINLDLEDAATVELDLRGRSVDTVVGSILTADTPYGRNTFEDPEAVTVREHAVTASEGPHGTRVVVDIPAHSYVTVSLNAN